MPSPRPSPPCPPLPPGRALRTVFPRDLPQAVSRPRPWDPRRLRLSRAGLASSRPSRSRGITEYSERREGTHKDHQARLLGGWLIGIERTILVFLAPDSNRLNVWPHYAARALCQPTRPFAAFLSHIVALFSGDGFTAVLGLQ